MDVLRKGTLRQNPPISNECPSLKPILNSRDIWIFHQHSEAAKITRTYSKSLRSVTIEHSCSGQKNNSNMRRMSRALGNNKYLKALDLMKHNQYPAQLKFLVGRMKKLNHLRKFKMSLNCSSFNQEIRHFVYFLRSLLSLTTLELELSLLDYGFPRLKQGKQSYGLKNLRHLTSLFINVSNTHTMEAQDMELISFNIKKCQYLQSLALDFGSCQNLLTEAVWMLASALQNLQSLTKLDLNFQRCERLDEKAINSLAFCLDSLQKIASFKLDLARWPSLDSNSIVLLSKSLKSQSHLKTLDFALPYYENIKKGINKFFQELVLVQPLLSLKLRIPSSLIIISEDFIKNFSQALKAQNQLEILKINLESAEIGGPWAKYLADSFQALKNLSKLSFTLKSSKSLNDKNAEDLGEALSKLTDLLILKLNLSENYFSQEGIRKVLEGIGVLNHLKEMNLNLEKGKSASFILHQVKSLIPFFKSSEIKRINVALNSLQNNLKVLRFNLTVFNSAASDLSFFSETLISMKQLSTLHLQLEKVNPSETLQKGLQHVFSCFKQINKLTDLGVTIHNGSDEDLQSFLASLKDCLKLEFLKISFSTERIFSLKTANQFIETMETLEKLYQLRLNIYFGPNKVQEVSLLWAGIKKLKSLSILHFDFGKTLIGYSQIESLEIFKSIRTLKTLRIFDGHS